MAKHPAEVFGCSFRAALDLPKKGRKKYSLVALCPRRFLQDNTVFKDIADHYFHTRNDLVVFSEIGLAQTGTLTM